MLDCIYSDILKAPADIQLARDSVGHILRKPHKRPLRLVLVQPHTDLEPRRPPTNDRVTNAVRGRPNLDWGQELLRKIHRYSGTTRREVYELAQDRRLFHQFIKRLGTLDDQH